MYVYSTFVIMCIISRINKITNYKESRGRASALTKTVLVIAKDVVLLTELPELYIYYRLNTFAKKSQIANGPIIFRPDLGPFPL